MYFFVRAYQGTTYHVKRIVIKLIFRTRFFFLLLLLTFTVSIIAALYLQRKMKNSASTDREAIYSRLYNKRRKNAQNLSCKWFQWLSSFFGETKSAIRPIRSGRLLTFFGNGSASFRAYCCADEILENFHNVELTRCTLLTTSRLLVVQKWTTWQIHSWISKKAETVKRGPKHKNIKRLAPLHPVARSRQRTYAHNM